MKILKDTAMLKTVSGGYFAPTSRPFPGSIRPSTPHNVTGGIGVHNGNVSVNGGYTYKPTPNLSLGVSASVSLNPGRPGFSTYFGGRYTF